jgi:hypothetical protein
MVRRGVGVVGVIESYQRKGQFTKARRGYDEERNFPAGEFYYGWEDQQSWKLLANIAQKTSRNPQVVWGKKDFVDGHQYCTERLPRPMNCSLPSTPECVRFWFYNDKERK